MIIPTQLSIIKEFAKSTNLHNGAVILDLDGTVLFEDQGKVFISGSVEFGVRSVVSKNIKVAINTLRFPLSVRDKIAAEWIRISGAPIPAVLLNGSLLGTFSNEGEGIEFFETAAYPLTKVEICQILKGMEELVSNEINDLILFYYPRDWRRGEIIWVPNVERIEPIRNKYKSASIVHSCDLASLEHTLTEEDICMILLLIDRPKDKLMAYQHQEPSSFFNRRGIDKAFGTRELARKHHFSLLDSVGGGNSVMDNFLATTGLAIIVGQEVIPYEGKYGTLRVANPSDLGDLLNALSSISPNTK